MFSSILTQWQHMFVSSRLTTVRLTPLDQLLLGRIDTFIL